MGGLWAFVAQVHACPWGWTQTLQDMHGNGYESQPELSLEDCAAWCDSRRGCATFEHQAAGLLCKTYTDGLASVRDWAQGVGWTSCYRIDRAPFVIAYNTTDHPPPEGQAIVCTIGFLGGPKGDTLHSASLPYSYSPGTIGALRAQRDHVYLLLDSGGGEGPTRERQLEHRH
jgi:hypothetical protein